MLLFLAIVGIGVFYFRLHALPEQMAHRGQKVQFEIVAVLGLLSLFTHNHLFWIAGLLLALVPMPDVSTPLRSMAQSLGRIAGDPPASRPSLARPADSPVVGEATALESVRIPANEDRSEASRES